MTTRTSGMQTSMPLGTLEILCLRCGDRWMIPVRDVKTEEWPGFNAMWEQVKFTVDGQHWITCSPDRHHVHHCPDGGLGFSQLIGIKPRRQP